MAAGKSTPVLVGIAQVTQHTNTRDAEVLDAMVAEEFCGRQGHIDTGGTVTF